MPGLLSKPLTWLLLPAGVLVAGVMAFALFQPVKVVPRIAEGPSYELVDQNGQAFAQGAHASEIALYGFGYTNDLTGGVEQTINDMRHLQSQVRTRDGEIDLGLILILFDDQRDTPHRLQQFASVHDLDLSNWTLLTGDADTLKRVIGQGFGIYYEAVPLSVLPGAEDRISGSTSADYGYLQAQRYILVDNLNIIRAEYRAPLDIEHALRDIRLIIREANSTGVSRTLNEAAHLFLCYPD